MGAGKPPTFKDFKRRNRIRPCPEDEEMKNLETSSFPESPGQKKADAGRPHPLFEMK